MMNPNPDETLSSSAPSRGSREPLPPPAAQRPLTLPSAPDTPTQDPAITHQQGEGQWPPRAQAPPPWAPQTHQSAGAPPGPSDPRRVCSRSVNTKVSSARSPWRSLPAPRCQRVSGGDPTKRDRKEGPAPVGGTVAGPSADDLSLYPLDPQTPPPPPTTPTTPTTTPAARLSRCMDASIQPPSQSAGPAEEHHPRRSGTPGDPGDPSSHTALYKYLQPGSPPRPPVAAALQRQRDNGGGRWEPDAAGHSEAVESGEETL
ncbi:unnamed protein product [Gadus morhua 'NCC']